MSGAQEVKELEYRSIINLKEENLPLEKAVQVHPGESRLLAIMAQLSPELKFVVDYDNSSDISYVAASRFGVQHGLAIKGKMPYVNPPILDGSRWSIHGVMRDVEDKIMFMSRNIKNPSPVGGHYFCKGVKYNLPDEAMSVKVSGMRVNFWPVENKGANIPEDRPEKVSFNLMRKPTWFYKE